MHASVGSSLSHGWKENSVLGFYQPGKPHSEGIRARAVRCWQQSEHDKKRGDKGSTWDEIAMHSGACKRSCQEYVKLFCIKQHLSPMPTVPNPVVIMGEDERLYLYDLYLENSGLQLQEYRELLQIGIGVTISESTLCTILQEMRLTLKKPEVVRKEKFCYSDGAWFGTAHSFCLTNTFRNA